MISVDEALALLRANPLSPGTERVCIQSAANRILAVSVFARIDQPAAPVSAMDGYAVRLADVQSVGSVLRIVGESAAGAPADKHVGVGEAIRIFTGAIVPDGADHILIQENCVRSGDQITTSEAETVSRHIRQKGIDFSKDDLLIGEGRRLGPAQLALIAAGNIPEVEVFKRPVVGLLANGNELRVPGSDLKPGEIVNSNAISLKSLFESWGAEVVDLGIASDSVESIIARVSDRKDIDLFVPVGGASVGDYDFMHEAFTKCGFDPVFRKVKVKPGKPTWFSVSDHQSVLGLPGNPSSAFICAHLFVGTLLGRDWTKFQVTGRLGFELPENGGRETFLRVRTGMDGNGTLRIENKAKEDSSLIHPFVSTNALLRRAPHADALGVDDAVTVIPLGDTLFG